jgi:circadian clock protein KaiC
MSRTQGKGNVGGIQKSATGVCGLDEITEGGLPKGRASLVCGGAGCGKTVLGMEFLVHGARDYNEPGVFMAFEETARELGENFASMNFDISNLCARKKLYVEHVRVERNEIEETGEYDLEGLFIRLQSAIDSVHAKRLVLDTIECLFAGFKDTNILRAELRRLFRWLKEKGVTSIVTAETGEGRLTRHGLEEYVADCVIFLDHRVINQNSIRRLRVIKYRGSLHSTNEYPFLIGTDGFSVLPVTSLHLDHKASTQRISTGIPRLDAMLGGKGFYRGTSVLVSGSAGTGKTSIAAHFVQAACRHGERALFFASEQSSDEIMRNMRSIGVDLQGCLKRGLLRFHALRAGYCGLEKHLVLMHDQTSAFSPSVVIVDPITNFGSIGDMNEVKSMLTRLIDFFKTRGITAMFTSLTPGSDNPEDSVVGVSSLMDAWLLLRNLESNGERNRALYVLKARGMAHSNQIREFLLTDNGAQLLEVYAGPAGVLTGSARLAQEAQERAEALQRSQEVERKQLELKRKHQQLEAQIAALHAEFDAEERELQRTTKQMETRNEQIATDRLEMARFRRADHSGNGHAARGRV